MQNDQKRARVEALHEIYRRNDSWWNEGTLIIPDMGLCINLLEMFLLQVSAILV